MKMYLVGGAVRDMLLGREAKDRDFLITGATHEELLEKGFLHVGKEFPIYLHPETAEEYTLANDLRLDLSRRDLSINAMALDMESGDIIDPFQGSTDLRKLILRHVSEKNFYDDPLRVYRVARLAGELPEFEIHPDTRKVMKRVPLDKLRPERVFKELVKVLQSPHPERFFEILKEEDLLKHQFQELASLNKDHWCHTMKKLRGCRDKALPARVSYAALFIELSETEAKELSRKLKVPNEWNESAIGVGRYYRKLQQVSSSEVLVNTLYGLDAYRRPSQLETICELLKLDGHEREVEKIIQSYQLTKSVSANDVPEELRGRAVGEAIRLERLNKLKQFL